MRSSLSLRIFARLKSALPAKDSLSLESSVFVRPRAQFGSTVFATNSLLSDSLVSLRPFLLLAFRCCLAIAFLSLASFLFQQKLVLYRVTLNIIDSISFCSSLPMLFVMLLGSMAFRSIRGAVVLPGVWL